MCSNCGGSAQRGGDTILRGSGAIAVGGSGTATDPYIITVANSDESLRFTVRDSPTVDLQLTGSGTQADPYVLRADTSAASQLKSLGDVSASPGVSQGVVPMWIGTPAGGSFKMNTPGTRYVTSSTKGSGRYQGEVVRETDTQKRFEWDGSQWLALDPSVVQNAGSVGASTDWNTLTTKSGIYRVGSGVTSTNNGPAGAYGFGTLEVLISGNSVTQTYYTHGSTNVYSRTKWNDTDWTAWKRLATQSDLDSTNANVSTISVNKPDRGEVNTAINNAIALFDNGRLDGRYVEDTFDDVTGNYSAASGWSISRLVVRQLFGRILMIDADMTRTGGTLTGDFGNTPVINCASGWGSGWYQALASGPSNWPHSSYVQGTAIYAASLPAGHNLETGDKWSIGGLWIRS